jgi:hypothetical protein
MRGFIDVTVEGLNELAMIPVKLAEAYFLDL